MKRTTLTIAILFSLAGPAAVVAEVPAVTGIPMAVEVVPADVESAVQQAVEALPADAPAAGAGLVQQPSVADTPSTEAVHPGAAVAEGQTVPETPAAVPGVEKTEAQAVAGMAAPDTKTSGDAMPKQPCPKYGMGMKHRGKGPDGKGMGGPGCKCKRKHKRHQQVVQRLDMIEARMAKIEAMLESLMKRQ